MIIAYRCYALDEIVIVMPKCEDVMHFQAVAWTGVFSKQIGALLCCVIGGWPSGLVGDGRKGRRRLVILLEGVGDTALGPVGVCGGSSTVEEGVNICGLRVGGVFWTLGMGVVGVTRGSEEPECSGLLR